MKSQATRKSLLVVALGISTLVLGTACGTEDVLHGLSEREANEIIELMHSVEPPIEAIKMKEEGGREITYRIIVPAKYKHPAYATLNKHELPRKKHKGYNEVFSQSGLIPTKSEEQAKSLSAVEGEIAKQLQLIPNVLEAEVNVVIPRDNPLRDPSDAKPRPSASVTLRYLTKADGAAPISLLDVQKLVSHGVENLHPDDVVVFLAKTSQDVESMGSGVGGGIGNGAVPMTGSFCKDGKKPVRFMGRTTCPEVTALIRKIIIAGAVILVMLAFVIIGLIVRGNKVKSRLMRLQAELQNARRRRAGGGGTAAGQSGVVPSPSGTGVGPSEKSSS